MDRRPSPTAESVKAGFSFVGMEHVDSETGRITIANGSRTGEGKGLSFRFDGRHVLFGKLRPYLRKIALPENMGCSSTELVPLLPNPDLLERRFLFHWLRRPQVADTLMAKNTGARMPRADMSVLLGMLIPLPPLDEQRRIVELLDRAAEIRHRADAARNTARALIPALFLDTFGDPATNPRGWPETTLSAVLSTGLSYGTMISPKATEDAWLDIRVANIQSGRVDLTDRKFVNLESSFQEKHSLKDADIILARAIGSEDHLGKSAIVFPGRNRWAYDSHVMRIRVDQTRISPIWLHALINTKGGKRRLLARSRKSAIQHNINTKEVASFVFGMPPLSLQTCFAEVVTRIEALARALDAAAAKTEKMAAALAAELFEARPASGSDAATAPSLAAD
jgi:type I restriction enzyme S subunit